MTERWNAMLAERQDYVPLEPLEPLSVLYLAGVSFCGSTLLSFIMNTHPEVVSVGEISPTARAEGPDYLCSCGAKLASCTLFASVRTVMARRFGVSMDPVYWKLLHRATANRYLDHLATVYTYPALVVHVRDTVREWVPAWRKGINWYARRNEAFIRSVLRVSGKRLFFDATKLSTRIPVLRRICGRRLLVLHLVRDPRGYAWSAGRHEGLTWDRAARNWTRSNLAVEHALAGLDPHRWIRIRYEDLCRDPDAVLARITGFAGVAPYTSDDPSRRGSHHIIGNEMRLSADPRPRPRLDETWRERLPAEGRDRVWALAGALAARYGYER